MDSDDDRRTALLDASRAQLVLVDYQARLMPAIAGADDVLRNAERLGRLARRLGVPCLGTEQSVDKLGPMAPPLRELCDAVIAKTRFDACADGLLVPLRRGAEGGRSELVVAGCEAHVCLMQTALGLLRAGFTVHVVADACASRAASNRELALARLERAGARLVSTEMVGFEWLRDAGHAAFRDWIALVR